MSSRVSSWRVITVARLPMTESGWLSGAAAAGSARSATIAAKDLISTPIGCPAASRLDAHQRGRGELGDQALRRRRDLARQIRSVSLVRGDWWRGLIHLKTWWSGEA